MINEKKNNLKLTVSKFNISNELSSKLNLNEKDSMKTNENDLQFYKIKKFWLDENIFINYSRKKRS